MLLRFFISCIAVLLLHTAAHAQLRPLDPVDYRALSDGQLRVQLGGGLYFDQHASLAGTTGRLLDAGDIRVSWGSDRVVIEVAGTMQRFFEEDSTLETSISGVQPADAGGKRHDSGDYRVQSILRLTKENGRTISIVRFGTRLPTTDNRVGLERDQTDFFATIGALRAISRFVVSGEAGVSINGTRRADYEQADVFVYAFTLEYRNSWLAPFISAVGQEDFHHWSTRGNEDLGEVRAGVRLGSQRRWLNAFAVRGFRDSSPTAGIALTAGVALGNRR